jgi:hypothetical protein
LAVAGRLHASSRRLDCALFQIDPQHGARSPDRIGNEHRNIADATAHIEHSHPRPKPAFMDQPAGYAFETPGLNLQTFDFRVGVAEQVLGICRHRIWPFSMP